MKSDKLNIVVIVSLLILLTASFIRIQYDDVKMDDMKEQIEVLEKENLSLDKENTDLVDKYVRNSYHLGF